MSQWHRGRLPANHNNPRLNDRLYGAQTVMRRHVCRAAGAQLPAPPPHLHVIPALAQAPAQGVRSAGAQHQHGRRRQRCCVGAQGRRAPVAPSHGLRAVVGW